ncbi:MAG TPA: glycoside hydrolase family 43 [Ruminococcus sp.]|nr:glycoside hydrolase family 43 [Ruminococcus sp.]
MGEIMKIRRFLSTCTAAVCALGVLTALPQQIPALQASASETIANPFIWSDVPDDDIIRVGDTYYMVSTTMYFSPGVPIMKSKDLFSWEICGYVYDTYADGAKQTLSGGEHDYAHGQWATSLRYSNGTFYVFFGSYGTGNSYVYRTDDIENGTWTRSEIRGMYHDASMLFDTDGRKYLVYGGGGEIKIKEFNDDLTGFKAGGLDKTLFKTGLDNLAGEGSHVHKIGDYYYVFVIAWPSRSGRIELCYRSKSLTGTFEGQKVLDSGLGTYGSGVAQGGVIDTPDGDWYALLFQDHGSVGRVPVLVPFTWENDWPVMGKGGKAPVTLTVPDGYTGTALAADDDFSYSANKLGLLWQWNHNPDNSAWSVTDRPGWLRLTNKSTASELLHARNTLTMRTEGPACSSVIKLDSSGMKAGDYAGLSAFQFRYGNVGVYVADNGSRYVYMAENGGDEINTSSNKIIEQVPMNGKEVFLKVEFNFNTVDGNFNVSNNIDKAKFYYSYDGSSWTAIGNTLSMSYDLKLFTGYRSGIYSYATKTTGGYADIDYFDYERAAWNQPVVRVQDADGYWFHWGFETGTDDFTGRGSAKVAQSSDAFQGSGALAATNREAGWNGASHALSSAICKPGETYSFSVNVKYDKGTDTDLFHFTLQYDDAEGVTRYTKIASDTIDKGAWVQLSNPAFTIPADASNMYIYVETEDSKTDFVIDDMIGAPEGTAIPGAGKSTFILGDVNKDGTINAADFSLAKQLAAKGAKDRAADVNCSGKVNAADLEWYQEYLLGKTKDYPEKTTDPREPGTMRTITEYTAAVKDSLVMYEPNSSHTLKSGVPDRKITKEYYFSKKANKQKPYNIMLPPDYDSSKEYPVLYILHGFFEDEDRMILTGNNPPIRTKEIICNAIAEGEAEEMIVVVPLVFTSATKEKATDFGDYESSQGYDNFVDDIVDSLMPHIEEKYSVATGRENTAVTGFSMGGRESLRIGMKYADKFGYIGAICPAPAVEGPWKWSSEEAAPSLILLTGGTDDNVVRLDTPLGYHNEFDKVGTPHLWHVVEGGYHGDNCITAHIYNFVRMIFKA